MACSKCGKQNKIDINQYNDYKNLPTSERLKMENKFLSDNDMTDENIKKLMSIKNIDYNISKQYFISKCSCCGKQLMVTEIGINLKLFYTILIKNPELKRCKTCLVNDGFNIDEWIKLVSTYRELKCQWF